jgi:intracellular sulfur oxidation DsrE/DsrF family protein
VAAQSASGLPLPQYGTIPDIPGAVNRPDPALTYKLVYDATAGSRTTEVHPVLLSLARMLNTMAQHGVPAERRHFAVVFHGPATAVVMNDEAFARRTGAAANPNTRILKELKAAGVELHVCGQAAKGMNITREMIAPEITLDLAGGLSLINFQTRGYVLVPN